ncbi:hypothetical protein KI387_030121, partial [Taxus chinensis]
GLDFVDGLERRSDLEDILDGFDLDLLIMGIFDDGAGPKIDGDAPKSDDVAL